MFAEVLGDPQVLSETVESLFNEVEENGCSMYVRGRCYDLGIGVEVDWVAAMGWYRKAAALGDDRAMLGIAAMYREGRGVSMDRAEALNWFAQAASVGSVPGMMLAGEMYREAEDWTHVREMYEQAVEAGESEAMLRLAGIYRGGLGVEANDAEAAKWLWRSASAGHPKAAAHLAICYRDGVGVEKDRGEYLGWLRKASDLGFVESSLELGQLYAIGEGVVRDQKEAMRLWRKAADGGSIRAMEELALAYIDNEDLRDIEEGVSWIKKGAAAGSQWAMGSLGNGLNGGLWGLTVDHEEAFRWLLAAAEKGLKEAMEVVVEMYEQGLGVPTSFAKARKWRRRLKE
jgi:TPR repeat protein